MGAPQNLRAVGDQIEQLLDELQATADPRSYERAAELLRLVSELYGAGLARVVALAQERDRELVEAFVGDDLVASLLTRARPSPGDAREPVWTRPSPKRAATSRFARRRRGDARHRRRRRCRAAASPR